MPVLKIKNNGVWEDIAGGSNGGQLNGGNADTVDGKHASDFADANDFSELQLKVGDETVYDQIMSAIEKIEFPVESVNGKTGSVVLTASDVGALPSSTVIPSIDGLATEDYVDKAIANIKTPEVNLTGYATETYVTDALKGKADVVHEHSQYALVSDISSLIGDTPVNLQISNAVKDKADINHGHNVATTNSAGFMSSQDKIKLDSINSDGNNSGIYVQNNEPTDSANGSVWIDLDDGEEVEDDSVSEQITAALQGYALESYVDEKVADIVNSAPETLDTLNELASALGNDPNLAATISGQIGDLQLKVGDWTVEEQINMALENFSSGKTLTEHLTEENMILTSLQYGDTLPDPGIPGRLFFKKVDF